MAKMTKAQARKRLQEAQNKVMMCIMSGHITLEQANKVAAPLHRLIERLK